jgi:hypothetical protein
MRAGMGGPSNPSQPQPIAKPAVSMGPGGPQADTGSAPPAMNISWEAADANNDELVYKLEYRPAEAHVWLPMTKDLKDTHYTWQTRQVPDGRYIVRVTASDAPDNTADAQLSDTRASDPVLIDNTPPELLTVKTTPGKGQIVITGRARDALSTISGLQYVVDAGDQWHYILSDDLIYDSTDETFSVKIPDLSSGQHVITLRAQDALGNAVNQAMVVDIR